MMQGEDEVLPVVGDGERDEEKTITTTTTTTTTLEPDVPRPKSDHGEANDVPDDAAAESSQTILTKNKEEEVVEEEEEEAPQVQKSDKGRKRNSMEEDDGEDDKEEDRSSSMNKQQQQEQQQQPKDETTTTKKAKIAMPPTIDPMLLEVEEYTLDDPPAVESTDADDRIVDSSCLILFGLHPLVREGPLKKLCQRYGTVQDFAVRSAFASRYGHVEYATTDEAKMAYRALNGAKLFQKSILVQPSKSSSSSSSQKE